MSNADETLYRLADGLYPIRLEPGLPLLMGRDGSPLRIELRSREKQGIDALVVYHPSGERPTLDAMVHALEPLKALVGDPLETPADAPPNAFAVGLRAGPRSPKGGVVEARREGLRDWLDETRLEALAWVGLEDARKEGNGPRDVIMAVFDAGNRAGYPILATAQVEKGVPRDEAERRVRSSAREAETAGSRLVFQMVNRIENVRSALESAGVLKTLGAALDAALATLPAPGDVPEGRVRAVLFEEDAVIAQLVAIRSPGERAADAKAAEQDAILQAVLDRVGEEVRSAHAARVQRGTAARNLAILVEEVQGGALCTFVGLRSEVARILEGLGERARTFVNALGKAAPVGETHAVFLMRREGKLVLIHRTTVVQGPGVN